MKDIYDLAGITEDIADSSLSYIHNASRKENQMSQEVQIFCSYAHKDRLFLSKLKTHLFSLQRKGLITTWSDLSIGPGVEWEKDIMTHLNSAHIILLLISPDFMASDYCYTKEMQQALKRHERGEAHVIPIFLRPVDWQDAPFGKLQALPYNAKPVTRWADQDEAFFEVAKGIRQVVEKILSEGKSQYALSNFENAKFQSAALSRAHHNLPRISNQFLGREKEIVRVLTALASRSYLICIEGLGGVGKTTLAIQTALYSLSDPNHLFEQIIWFSAVDRPDQENWFNEVLDTIARELGSPALSKMPLEQKALEVELLLNDQSILVIIDNYETINDTALSLWIEKIPAPSKVLITSRASIWRNAYAIQLRGLQDSEALKLIRNHSQRWELPALEAAHDETLLPLVKVTGGNPRAIELALGHIKRGGLSLEEVIDHLHIASESVNDIFGDLYNRSWEVMKRDARYMLMATPFFADSMSREALGFAAGLSTYNIKYAVEDLVQFMFLDVSQGELTSSPRYSTHPLTRAFACTQLDRNSSYEQEARSRWSTYYLDLITRVLSKGQSGNPYWDTLVRSGEAPTIDREWLNIRKILEWADQEGHDQVLINLILVLAHYMNRHFYYSERLSYTQKAAVAADRLHWKREAALFRIDTLGWTLIETNQLADAKQEIMKGLHIAQTLDSATAEAIELIALAHIFLARVALQQGNLVEASTLMQTVESNKCRPVIQFRAAMIAGDIAYRSKNVDEALRLYEHAHNLSYQYGSEGEDEDLSYRMAIAYLAKGDLTKAQHSFKNLPNVDKYASVTTGAIYARLEEAHFAKAKGEKEKARLLAQEALNYLSPAIESHWMLDEVHNFLKSLGANP